jgi:hypothetical protein
VKCTRRGLILVDVLLALGVMASLGLALLQLHQTITRQVSTSETQLKMRHLARQTLASLAAGDAVPLLLGDHDATWTVRRTLVPPVEFARWHPTVTVGVTLPHPPEPGQPIRVAIASCIVEWSEGKKLHTASEARYVDVL